MREPLLRERLLGVLFPSSCYCCGEFVENGRFLCPDCEESLTYYRVRRMKTIRRHGQAFSIRACYSYQEAAKEAILRLKFEHQVRPAKYMGEAIADRVKAAPSVRPDVITFVPMLLSKEMRVGYNPPQLIAEHAGKWLRLPVRRLLKKNDYTLAQHTLSANQRKQNVVGAFSACGDVKGKRILLVDDVVTTGSTLSECASELLKAGASAVWPIAYASTGGKPRVDREESLEYNKSTSI